MRLEINKTNMGPLVECKEVSLSPMKQLLACKELFLKQGGPPGFLDEQIKNFFEPADKIFWESLLRHGFLDEIIININNNEVIEEEATKYAYYNWRANFQWRCVRQQVICDLLQDFTVAQLSPTLPPHLSPIVDKALDLIHRLSRTIPLERVEILPGEKLRIYGIEGYDEPLLLEATATKCLGTLVFENTKA